MPFPITCPACQTTSPCPDQFAGRKVKCKKCGQAFVAKNTADEPDIVDDAEVLDDAELVEEPKPKPKAPPLPKPKVKAPPRRDEDEDDEDEAPAPKAKSKRPRDEDEDEDEAPRKSKKKQAAAKGVPPMAYVLMALFGLLLLGGGTGLAYWAVTYEKEPTQLAADKLAPPPGGPPQGLAMGGGGGQPKNNGNAGWVDVRDAEQRFSVKFPQKPVTRMQKQPLPTGEMIDVKLYAVEIPQEVFIASGSDTQAPPGTTPDTLLDTATDLISLSLAAKGVVRAKRTINYQNFPGRELEVVVNEAAGFVMIARLIIANDKVYTVMTGGLGVTTSSPRVKTFFESLKIE